MFDTIIAKIRTNQLKKKPVVGRYIGVKGMRSFSLNYYDATVTLIHTSTYVYHFPKTAPDEAFSDFVSFLVKIIYIYMPT